MNYLLFHETYSSTINIMISQPQAQLINSSKFTKNNYSYIPKTIKRSNFQQNNGG